MLIPFYTDQSLRTVLCPHHRTINKPAVRPETGSSGARPGLSSAPLSCNAGHGRLFHSLERAVGVLLQMREEGATENRYQLGPAGKWVTGGLEALSLVRTSRSCMFTLQFLPEYKSGLSCYLLGHDRKYLHLALVVPSALIDVL